MRNDTFSGMVFRASSYRANRIRNNADFRALCDGSKETMAGSVYSGVTFGMFEVTANDYETAAKRLDDAFVFNYRLDQFAYVNWKASTETALTMSVGVLFNDFTVAGYAVPYKTFSRYNVAWVWFYYDLWQFDYVMAIISIVALAIIYLNITSAMMKRAIELTMLMVVSPAVVAVTPLDGGGMQKRWRENFIKKTLSAYGAVVGVNLLFIILPIIRNVNFFNIPIVDTIVQLLFTIVGLTCIKDFMKMMSELVGGEDAQSIGADVNKKMADTAMKVGSVAASVAMPAAGALKGMMTKSIGGLAGKGVGKGIGRASAMNQAKREQTKEWEAAGFSKDQIKEMRRDSGYSSALKEAQEKRADQIQEQRKYRRFTKDLEQREKNKFIRDQIANDTKNGIRRSSDEYEREADAYIASDAGQAAIKKRQKHRNNLNKVGGAGSSALRFMGTMAGQVVEGTYGDKLYDGVKAMRNASEGKPTSAFGGAAAKEAKERGEKESAKQQQQQENDRQSAMLSAQEKTNELLNQVIRRL